VGYDGARPVWVATADTPFQAGREHQKVVEMRLNEKEDTRESAWAKLDKDDVV
jgi:hypothetical protein